MALIASTAGAQVSSPSPAPQQALPAHPWDDRRLAPDERARLVVEQMTQDEKFAWLSGPMAININGGRKPEGAIGSAAYYPGIARLGIPAMQQTDASLGVGNLGDVRPGDNATALPSSLVLGASFDPAIATATGEMVGREARAKGFNVQLAGGANLVREPRGGRNFEYISEDVLLTGRLAGYSVAGIQSQGVVATVKHFVLNAQETGRVMVSSDLNEAAMRESDLLAFQIAIENGKPGSVMPGYNLVNGHYASENAFLLNTVLKGEWKYPGWVMSDWGATHSTEKAIMAGLDVQSGANLDAQDFFGAPLRAAVAKGSVSQARIDDAVRRQLRSLFAVGVIDNPPVAGQPIDYSANKLVAQRAAEGGIVLLKNEGDILPLAKGAKRILVVGQHADSGVLSGGGSSSVTPIGSIKVPGYELMGITSEKVYHPSSPLRAIQAEGSAAKVDFVDGKDLGAATRAAHGADVVVIFAEEWRAEGLDAQGLGLPDKQDELIDAMATANPRTIVVLESGGAVTMPWLAKVPAVLAAFYPGSGGAEAIAGVLFGRVNPSGRLPITFPASVTQLPIPAQRDPETTTSNPGTARKGSIFHVSYDREGADAGYRWYVRENLKPLFPFGHGLSYTRFDYSDLTVRPDGDAVVATVTVRNTGARVGADVAQAYVSLSGRGGFPVRLVGFDKVTLAPGESRRIQMRVDPRLIARFDSRAGSWRVAAGTYRLAIGRDAVTPILHADIALAQKVFRS
ncbi:beta-glucosidase [Sphingomonas faeni]|uniref:beta-glucosidase n=1 Tax=Sphingomonas faeni TaxID=185950 RepID=UPI0024134BB9|nr:glycoside hydrolase family 3 C-terminal domain-containing protein [Sphingomonas faeni]